MFLHEKNVQNLLNVNDVQIDGGVAILAFDILLFHSNRVIKDKTCNHTRHEIKDNHIQNRSIWFRIVNKLLRYEEKLTQQAYLLLYVMNSHCHHHTWVDSPMSKLIILPLVVFISFTSCGHTIPTMYHK